MTVQEMDDATACLPEGWSIVLTMTRNEMTMTMFDPDGDECEPWGANTDSMEGRLFALINCAQEED